MRDACFNRSDNPGHKPVTKFSLVFDRIEFYSAESRPSENQLVAVPEIRAATVILVCG